MSKRTISGINERMAIEDINIGGETTDQPFATSEKPGFLRKVSLFLAGMYTGIGCAGTPHDYRKTDSAGRDNRPI